MFFPRHRAWTVVKRRLRKWQTLPDATLSTPCSWPWPEALRHGRAGFAHDHRAWFRLWLPLGGAAPSRDTCLRLVRRRDPETAVKAALRLPGHQPARAGGAGPGPGRQGGAPLGRPCPGAAAPAHGGRLPGAGGADRGPGAVRCQEQRDHGHPPPARPHPPGRGRGHDRRRRPPEGRRAGPAGGRCRPCAGPGATGRPSTAR